MEFHGVLKKMYDCVPRNETVGLGDGCAVQSSDCFYIGSSSGSQEPPLPVTVAPLTPTASSGL